jgi:hypothetical protein
MGSINYSPEQNAPGGSLRLIFHFFLITRTLRAMGTLGLIFLLAASEGKRGQERTREDKRRLMSLL